MITYYVGASEDGFIATEDDSLDFLDAVEPPEGEDYGYQAFFDTVDICVWGRKTYDWVMERADFPYPNKENWILSRSRTGVGDHNEVFGKFEPEHWRELRQEKSIWMVGGTEVATLFQSEKLIDRIILTVIPTKTGSGKPLFAGGLIENQWNRIDTKKWANGVTQMTYSSAKAAKD